MMFRQGQLVPVFLVACLVWAAGCSPAPAEPSLFMGRLPEAQVELDPGLRDIRVLIGDSLVAVCAELPDQNTTQAVFFRQDSLQEVGRIRFDDPIADFFWGDLYVVVSSRSARIYAVSGEKPSVLWEGKPPSSPWLGGEVVGEERNCLVLYADDFVQALTIRGGAVSPAWEAKEPWHITHLAPHGGREILIATARRGWLLLDLASFSLRELGAGGPHEAQAWKKLGRPLPDDGLLQYRFCGVTNSGIVLAMVPADTGAYYQVWAPADGGLALVAENFLVSGEVSLWQTAEDDPIGGVFRFHPATSRWLSFRALEIYGAVHAVLELDEPAVARALEAGRCGEEARLERTRPAGRPLSKFFTSRKWIGYRDFSSLASILLADFSGEGEMELLGHRPEGVYLITGDTGAVREIRVAGHGVIPAGVDEKRRHVYLLNGGALLRFTFKELLKVKRQTVHPSPKARWTLREEGTITGLVEEGERLYLSVAQEQAVEGGAGYVRSREKATGKENWYFPVAGRVRGPAVAGGLVFFLDSANGVLYAVDASSGEERWRVRPGDGPPLTYETPPAASRGQVYLSARYRTKAQGCLFAFDCATGKENWRLTAEGHVGSAAPADDLVYVGVGDHLYVLDRGTGKVEKKLSTGINQTMAPVVAGELLLCGGWGEGEHTYLYALDRKTGEKKWEFRVGYKARLRRPALAEGAVYLPSFEYGDTPGCLHALDLETGREKWQRDGRYQFASAAEQAYGLLYISDRSGYLYALDAETATIKWEFKGGEATRVPLRLPGPPSFIVAGKQVVYLAFDSFLSAVEIGPSGGKGIPPGK